MRQYAFVYTQKVRPLDSYIARRKTADVNGGVQDGWLTSRTKQSSANRRIYERGKRANEPVRPEKPGRLSDPVAHAGELAKAVGPTLAAIVILATVAVGAAAHVKGFETAAILCFALAAIWSVLAAKYLKVLD